MRTTLVILAGLSAGACLAAQEPADASFKTNASFKMGTTTAVCEKVSGKSAPMKVAGRGESVPLSPVEGEPGSYRGAVLGLDIDVKLSDSDDLTVAIKKGDEVVAEMTAAVTKRDQGGQTVLAWNLEDTVAIGDSSFQPMAQKRGDTLAMSLVCREPVYVHGVADGADGAWHVAVVDQDADGTYGSKGDYWSFVPEAGIAAAKRGFSENNMIEAFEPVYLDGGLVAKLAGVTDDGVEIAIEPAADTLSDYLHRRNERVGAKWKHRFDTEIKGLLEQRAEPGRAKAAEPIEWMHTLSLDEAMKRAKAENKLILVDFETDWCIWCKVLDNITYPDAEVTAYVNEHFVPVKINAEFPIGDLLEKYEVRGFPGMPILDAEGNKVDFISGFKPPSQYVESLKGAWAKHTGDK